MKLNFIILLLTLMSCSGNKNLAEKSSEILLIEIDNEILKQNVGQKVTIIGKSLNAKLGPLLKVENSNSIWIDDFESWPKGYYLGENNCKTLKVTGTIIEKYDKPVFIYKEGDVIQSGIPVPEGTDLKKASYRYLLKNITWEIINE